MASGLIIQVSISNGGVPKLPIAKALVNELGIEQDKHLYRFHGGKQKALLLMAAEFINTLAVEGFKVHYGALGENLTTKGLPPEQWRTGQRYRAGSALLQLTELRVPCRKLQPYGAGIEKRILGQGGFYAAVLEGGTIEPGDTIQLVDSVVSYARPGSLA